MDAQQLKEHLILNNQDAMKILESVGCHGFHEYSKEIRCALPNKNNTSAVVLNKERMSGRIYLPNDEIVRGDIYTLVGYFNQSNFINSFKYCTKLLGFEVSYYYQKSKQEDFMNDPFWLFRKVKKQQASLADFQGKIIDEEYMHKFLQYPHINFLKDNISISTQKKFGICYDEISDRIVIPHYKWDTGEIIGLFGRTALPNYKELGIAKYFGLKPYPKMQNLYGLYQNYAEIQKRGYVVVLEAEKSVMQLHTMGLGVGVAVCCHELSPIQRKILIGLDVEIIIAFDNDISLEHILNTVKPIKKYRKCSYIKDVDNLLGEKDSPTDRGLKIWEYLFNKRK